MDDDWSFKSLRDSFHAEFDDISDDDQQEILNQKCKEPQKPEEVHDLWDGNQYFSGLETFSCSKQSSKAVKPTLRFSSKLETSTVSKPQNSNVNQSSSNKMSVKEDDISGNFDRDSKDSIDTDDDSEDGATTAFSKDVIELEDNEPASSDEDYQADEYLPKFGYAAQLRELLQNKKQQPPTSASEFLDVRIMDEQLEAHLTSCKCEVLNYLQNSERVITAIFDTSKTPIDLQVGRVVRIYSPWHELPDVKGYGKVILCTSNSEMLSRSNENDFI